jgi:hypothetical protein
VLQKYLPEYQVKYPVVRKSSVSDSYAYCTTCRCDFSIGHGGIGDVIKHVKTSKHVKKAGDNGPSTHKIKQFFVDSSSKDLSVIRAEVMFTDFIVEHNLPLACADHAGPLFRQMLFPDSNIATKYACARTKTSCVLQTLSSADAQHITAAMKSGPFSIATDGSNDVGSVKLYPLCVRYFDNDIGKVLCVMLSMPECAEASTGENIFNLMDNELKCLGVPWSNCVCIAANNASVMMGKHKGVVAFLKKTEPSVYVI